MDRELLQRYVEGNVSDQEVEKVVDWLDQDESHVNEFMALQKLYNITIWSKEWVASKPQTIHKKISLRSIGFEAAKICAVFLLAISFSHYLYLKQESTDPTYQTLIVPAGQRAELILPDSTHVWLNAKTTLVYPTHFNKDKREVKLDGEAYFDVRHKKEQPFIVQTEKLDIHVLGTEFNVHAYGKTEKTEVALLNGGIELLFADNNQRIIMKPNELIKFADNQVNRSLIREYDYFKWKEGLLVIRNESVATIFEKLELYFDTNITTTNQQLLDTHYNGKFRIDDGVEQVLKVLQLENNFTYTRDRELNVITIK